MWSTDKIAAGMYTDLFILSFLNLKTTITEKTDAAKKGIVDIIRKIEMMLDPASDSTMTIKKAVTNNANPAITGQRRTCKFAPVGILPIQY